MLALIISYLFIINNIDKSHEESLKKDIVFYVTSCDSIPEMNKAIVAFADAKKGRKVGRGECWDLASEALKSVDATWDGAYKYGRKIDPEAECIYPGDIVQFEGVKLKYTKDGMEYTENMPHHTAIIHKVISAGVYELSHQNTAYSGRKVGVSNLDFNTITKGKYTIYRPTR